MSQPTSSSSPGSSAGASFTAPSVDEVAAMLPAFAVHEQLGVGGMGAVYRGHHDALDRDIAIKILPRELVGQGNFAQRFRTEAETLAALDHPGIVALYDFGATSDAHLYFAMEFVAGPTLGDLITAGGLEFDLAMSIVSDACAALHYAHQRGIIHRDVKPSNILVTPEGRAKLADFGLAKLADPEGNGGPSPNSLVHDTASASGTPQFIAPEQMSATAIDHRADIYSLGAVLYLMLTGKLPIGAFYPPSQRNPAIHPAFDRIIEKTLRTRPEDRYPDIDAFRHDIELACTDPDQLLLRGDEATTDIAPSTIPPGNPARFVIVTLMATLATAALLFVLIDPLGKLSPNTDAPATAATPSTSPSQNDPAQAPTDLFPASAPDGALEAATPTVSPRPTSQSPSSRPGNPSSSPSASASPSELKATAAASAPPSTSASPTPAEKSDSPPPAALAPFYPPLPATPDIPELATLLKESKLEELSSQADTLRTNYKKALQRAISTDPAPPSATFLALRDEINDLQNDRLNLQTPRPDDPTVARLRKILHDNLAPIDRHRTRAISALDAALEQLEAQLTAASRIDDAIAVRRYRDNLTTVDQE